MMNHIDDARDTASAGFRKLDEDAGDTTINIGDMVLELYDLMEGMQLGDTRNPTRLQNFFSSKSELFRVAWASGHKPCSKTWLTCPRVRSVRKLSIIFSLFTVWSLMRQEIA